MEREDDPDETMQIIAHVTQGFLDEARLHGLTGEQMLEIVIESALQKMELN
jgi:hypothetical protein